ncbi:hypothetical protein CY35_08G001600 [Sphagnum magellanicum]|nr:hypothetical protein CY35_08G001600 [Sphagnum magellanicum]
MFLTRSEYDRGVNTFSPEGRLFQVEYAIEAIKLGSTAVGLKTKQGVILAVEKRITSPLLEPSSVEKIMEIDEHIGCAMSGLTADARTLVEHGRVETQNHRFSYNEPMSVESTTQALCDLALRFGEGDEESMSRPFGVSLLIAGHDDNGPCLYHTDPSGTFWQCNAKAIGSGSEEHDTGGGRNTCTLYLEASYGGKGDIIECGHSKSCTNLPSLHTARSGGSDSTSIEMCIIYHFPGGQVASLQDTVYVSF